MKLRISEVRSFVRFILEEGIVDDVKEKFPGESALVDDISKKVKLKFLKWAVNRVILDKESVEEVIHSLEDFEKNSQRLKNKDINSFDSLEQLQRAIESIGVSNRKTKAIVKGDSETIGKVSVDDGREIVIIMPKSKDAACLYGAGTKWCISATKSKNYYNSYAAQNNFFYFLLDSNPIDQKYKKVAIVMRTSLFDDSNGREIFDSQDDYINPIDLSEEWGEEVTREIFSIIERDFATRQNTFENKLSTETDPEKLIELAKTGKYDEILMRNPNFPHESYPQMFFRSVESDADAAKLFSDNFDMVVKPNVSMLQLMIDKFGPAYGVAAALYHIDVPIPSQTVHIIATSGTKEAISALGFVKELLPDQIDWLISKGPIETIRILARRPEITNDYWEKILEKNDAVSANEVLAWSILELNLEVFLKAAKHALPSYVQSAIIGLMKSNGKQNREFLKIIQEKYQDIINDILERNGLDSPLRSLKLWF